MDLNHSDLSIDSLKLMLPNQVTEQTYVVLSDCFTFYFYLHKSLIVANIYQNALNRFAYKTYLSVN